VVEVREVLRGWLEGAGLRKVAERAGVDRKTARRYVEAAQAAGLTREAGLAAVDDALVGAVVGAVRPVRPDGHGPSWALLEGHREQVRGWVKDGLSIVKIEELLARQGCVAPYRTLHRFAVQECGFRVAGTTVRVADGDPGVECQIDFAQLGFILDPETGRRRRVHAAANALHIVCDDFREARMNLVAAYSDAVRRNSDRIRALRDDHPRSGDPVR
jgi:hypothetical protein